MEKGLAYCSGGLLDVPSLNHRIFNIQNVIWKRSHMRKKISHIIYNCNNIYHKAVTNYVAKIIEIQNNYKKHLWIPT